VSPFRLAVVVPTHEGRERLEPLLKALASQTLPADAFEVVVVCDGCTDGSTEAAIAAAAPGGPAEGLMLSVVEQVRSGAGAARNRGFGSTTAPLVVFLDDEALPERDLLAAHEAAHAAHPGALVLGVRPDGRQAHSPRADDVRTSHLSMTRDGFRRLDGFDDEDDGAFGRRAVEAGLRLVYA
jgi:glycosyltransferase involved in cell wall biosynthesis